MSNRKSTIENRKSTIVNSQSKKVWRIFRFTERYELPEDVKICRKSSLHYVKLFVGISAGDEAVGYEQQMAMMCNGDGQQSAMIEGLYGKLVKMAGKHSYYRRGYLIDAAGEPLTVSMLARLLNFPQPTMKKWIKRFEQVRLLEKVEQPDFEKLLEDGDTEKPKNQPKNEDNSGTDRNAPKRSGTKRNVPESFKKTTTTKTPKGVKTNRKRKATNGKRHAVGSKKKNGNNVSNASALEREVTGYAQCQEPRAEKPKESDLGGEASRERCKSPPGAVYDQSDVAYGKRILRALGYNGEMDEGDAWREITSFASVYHDCRKMLCNLPPPEIDNLGIRGLREADRICRRRKQRKRDGRLRITNPPALWNRTFQKIARSKASVSVM